MENHKIYSYNICFTLKPSELVVKHIKESYFNRSSSIKYSIIIKQMISVVKTEENQTSVPIIRTPSKKERIGRWSAAECYLFQSLLQKYGKNWRQIHQHMKNRSLSQIRSHAQKYFDKIGPTKMKEFQRRAKLLQAYETLEKEKQFQDESLMKDTLATLKIEGDVKSQEESPVTTEVILPGQTCEIKAEVQENKKESIIKEQFKGLEKKQISSQQKMQVQMPNLMSNSNQGNNCGFLIQILNQNMELFRKYQGIEPFIDNSVFRASAFKKHIE